MYEYGKKYVYIDNEYENDKINKYKIVTFLLDRPDREEMLFEQNFSIFRHYFDVPYSKITTNVIEPKQALTLIQEEIDSIECKHRKGLPPIYFLQKYQQLAEEIKKMKEKLDTDEYCEEDIPNIHKSIREKEKGMRRIKKHSLIYFRQCDVDIDTLNIRDYTYKGESAYKIIKHLEDLKKDIEYIVNK